MKAGKVALFLVLLTILASRNRAYSYESAGIYFDDSSSDTIYLGNDFFEVAFRKSNGSIVHIIDKSTGQAVTDGSRNECLWGAVFYYGSNVEYIGGCSYSSAWNDRHFSYEWQPFSQQLVLVYTFDSGASKSVSAQVVVVPSAGNWFDMKIELQNSWSAAVDAVLFPSDLLVTDADIQELLLPVMPGVVLEPGFFAENRSYEAVYPGLFADFLSLKSAKGSMATYTVRDQEIVPSRLGYVHDQEYAGDRGYLTHTFRPQIGVGKIWESPFVRIRVSDSHRESAVAYREDNKLDEFLSLREKLGGEYETVVRSPLYKFGFHQRFEEYLNIVAKIPPPGILHMVGFWDVGFDENYPDFLPPRADLGSQGELINLMRQSQAAGFLMMPYTNPTWWDDESPTLRNLPPTLNIEDLAVRDEQGVAMYECYTQHDSPPPCNKENAARDSDFNKGGPPFLHGGYVVSPHPQFVRQRIDQLMREMTVDIPSDLVFEDQIGARPAMFDYNNSAPAVTSYAQGWLDHTRKHSSERLMTESGLDFLAETEAGFHGSLLLAEEFGYADGSWGKGNWRPYPLAPILVRDKVLFYQHNLDEKTMTQRKKVFSWNIANGYMFSYDLGESAYGGGVNSDWLNMVSVMQRKVLSRYATEEMTEYKIVQDDVSRTSFESFRAIVNWQKTSEYNVGEHTIAPLGAVVRKNDGSLIAGVFTRFNGSSLSGGDHFLVEERGSTSLTIYQPVGGDTQLRLIKLPSWSNSGRFAAIAFGKDGKAVGSAAVSVDESSVSFRYRQEIAGRKVSHYTIYQFSNALFLPMITQE